MGLINRISLAFNALRGRLKIGALEGGLRHNIKNFGLDSPRAQMFLAQIVKTAWDMRIISTYFGSMGFSFEDYAVMYHAAVRACPNMLIEDKKLIATFIFVDNYQKLGQGLYAYSKTVSGQIGDQRAEGLAVLVTSLVNDIMRYKEGELSPS